jgi:Flp pilus assembly protein CpaB
MEASTATLPRSRLQRLLTTRRGTLALAGLCALIAAALLMVFLARYRNSLTEAAAPTPVLVATSLVQKGTSGSVLAEKRAFEVIERKAEQIKQGALADPAMLQGKVAAVDIYPGQQITAAAFTTATGTVLPKLADDQRAISLPVDHEHGLIGQVQTGDHVDVLASYGAIGAAAGGAGQVGASGVVRTLLQDLLVLRAPKQPIEGSAEGEGADSSIVVRASDEEAARLAHVADFGKVWILLRPAANAKENKPVTVNQASALAGSETGFKATIERDGDTVTVTGGPTP